jgi:hypothetical protein
MVDFQIWLVRTFARATPIARLMHTKWAWPASESIHFISLSLLVGTIFLFDLRLLGLGKRIPIGALHKLVPWGLGAYAASLGSGILFLLAEPDQYVYNPAFQWKVLFMVAAGVNASLFYFTSYRRTTRPGAPPDAPRFAKVIAVASLSLWLGVIVAGRLLTFYRPYPCGPAGAGTIAQCLPNYYAR